MLAIQATRGDVLARLGSGPVVVSGPTGSGKSTQVPRWLSEAGRVVVIEPRRVACRALAARVAELEGAPLGEEVGYVVRDDHRARPDSRIVFVTTGVAMRMMASGDLDAYDAVVIDELHERTLDIDLLLALLLHRPPRRLVAMSATIDADRVAAHVGGAHVAARGRIFPVQIRYEPGSNVLPEPRALAARVEQAVAESHHADGDVLVFLPGRGEIAMVADRLRGRPEEVVPLHGGLSLSQQSTVFTPGARRRIVLATNVAETSVTLPRIGVVIDSGLVRQTRYHRGRGYLTLVPVARDSADQRAGRAGRLRPGTCIRLWAERAPLAASTPPEIHRESLVPLVLAAAACGHLDVAALPFLDAPRAYAVDDAREELAVLGALDAEGSLTPRGRALFGLPLDANLGRLVQEAEARGCLADILDLIATLQTPRRLFRARGDDDLRASGCDATARIRAVRTGDAGIHGLDRYAVDQARGVARRLRSAWGLPPPGGDPPIDRRRLAFTAASADPRCCHIARHRKRHVGWSNGGTELELGSESAIDATEVEAIAVIDTADLDDGRRRRRIVTCAIPMQARWLAELGLGTERVERAELDGSRVVARIQRVFAGRTIATRAEEPTGSLARAAVVDLLLTGRLFSDTVQATRERFDARALFARIGGEPAAGITADDWIRVRVDELGVEDASDVALLTPDDFLAEDLAPADRATLDRHFPRRLDTRDAVYRLRYDVPARVVTLDRVRGTRTALPPLGFLPRFSGWRIEVKHDNVVRLLRDHR